MFVAVAVIVVVVVEVVVVVVVVVVVAVSVVVVGEGEGEGVVVGEGVGVIVEDVQVTVTGASAPGLLYTELYLSPYFHVVTSTGQPTSVTSLSNPLDEMKTSQSLLELQYSKVSSCAFIYTGFPS